MKKLVACLFTVILIKVALSQNISGTVVTKFINAAYLQNSGGENPNRRATIRWLRQPMVVPNASRYSGK